MDESETTPLPDDLAGRILASLGEGVVAFDGAGLALGANRRMGELMGWRGKTVSGTPAAELFAQNRELGRAVSDALSGISFALDQDVVLAGHPSEARHLRVSTAPLVDEAGSGALLVARDVSDLKRVEREIFQAEKMSALGRLAASVAHEVRNPLGAINIQLDLLAEDLDAVPEEARERIARRIAIATAEITRMDRIVANFLRFSRPPRLRLERVSLNDVVRRVFDLVTPEAREKGITIEQNLAHDLPPIEGDEGQLGQAVLNMTVNAFHAVGEGGTVRAESSVTADGAGVRVRLSDTGCGIDTESLDRIFELYYTTKDEGTGLGLSIAQRIIYDHGGRLDVASTVGEGTTFEMTFPGTGSACPAALRGEPHGR